MPMMAMSPEGAALSVASDMVAAWAKPEKDGHVKICPMLNVAPCIGLENRSIVVYLLQKAKVWTTFYQICLTPVDPSSSVYP